MKKYRVQHKKSKYVCDMMLLLIGVNVKKQKKPIKLMMDLKQINSENYCLIKKR